MPRPLDSAGAPVAALIHLAGLFERDPFDPNDHGVWDRAIAANLTNAYDLAVAFATRYDNRDGPARIVLTSSVAYRRGSAGYPPYAAAKAGLVGLTRSLARRLAPDVLVNAVAPGLIDTRMAADTIAERGEAYKNEIPLKRYGHPAEVASVIRFLCSHRFVLRERSDDHGGRRHHQRLNIACAMSPCSRHRHCRPRH